MLIKHIDAEWGLKDMARSYDDGSVKMEVVVKTNIASYVPVKKESLCEKFPERKYKACTGSKRKLNILLIDQLPVMATQLGCGKRMFHLLEALVGLGHIVSMGYIRPDSHEVAEDKMLMEKLGVPVLRSPLLYNNVKDDFKQLLLESKPDVILMSLWYWQTDKPWWNAPGLFMTFTKKTRPDAKVIIISDDVHWLRLQKLSLSRVSAGVTSEKNAMSPEAEVAAIRLSEYQNYGLADAVVTISYTDKKSILRYDVNKELGKSGKVHVVPFVASPWETLEVDKVPPYHTRSGLIFVGNMVNPTNIEGLRWFLKAVMPQIVKHLPSCRLTIIGGGAWPFQDIPPLPPIRYLGWLSWEQMSQELNAAKVFISPIVVSTGVNTKNALAMSNGVPLVTTKIGASGLCGRCDEDPVSVDTALDSSGGGGLNLPEDIECPFVVASDELEFTRAVLELYNDEILWNIWSRRGLENTESYLSVKNEATAIEEVMDFTLNLKSGTESETGEVNR